MVCFLAVDMQAQGSISFPTRTINRCAQDGVFFYAYSLAGSSKSIQVERDGVTIRIERPNDEDAVITFQRGDKKLTQKVKDFDASYGWITISENGGFALTWNFNASAASTQLFGIDSNGQIIENNKLLSVAEHAFTRDAMRFCKNPGTNSIAVKWLDKDHLLVSINAWLDGFCTSNFTEGFVLAVPQNMIQRKLTEAELIDLPAVCTWNVVPVKH